MNSNLDAYYSINENMELGWLNEEEADLADKPVAWNVDRLKEIHCKLLAEPKHPNSYPLSEKQKQTLIAMVDCDQAGTIYTVYGRVNRIAMKRLEKRGLVVCTAEGTLISPKLEIGSAYDLTSAGQHAAYNLTDYLPF